MPIAAERPIATDASAGGAPVDADLLQDLADAGMSRRHIAELLGVSRRCINYWLRLLDISTSGHAHRKAHEVHGTTGKQATKLLPSSAALRSVSIFHLGG